MNENINDYEEFENIFTENISNSSQNNSIVEENTIIDDNTENNTIKDVSNELVENTINDLQNETSSNTVAGENTVTIATIHDDLVFIGSFLIFFTIFLLIKTIFKFFDMFF